MGIFKKMKRAMGSKANAALSRVIDPNAELDIIILDLETQRKKALQELISYKATARQMEHSIEEQEQQVLLWEKRAMIAVKRGDDDTAKECLQRKKQCGIEVIKIKRDQAEAAGYAAELNASRKQFDVKLRILKLKKGTMAAQLATARSGKGDAFVQSEELFDKMDEAERRMDDELFEQQAAAELDGEQETTMALESALLKAARQAPVADAPDDPLAELKARMGSEKKQLKD